MFTGRQRVSLTITGPGSLSLSLSISLSLSLSLSFHLFFLEQGVDRDFFGLADAVPLVSLVELVSIEGGESEAETGNI